MVKIKIKDIIRSIKSIFVKDYELAYPSIDQYGKPETYKETFYEVVRAFQKEHGLKKKEGIEYAETIFRARDKAIREAKKKDMKLTNYEALEQIREADIISDLDFDVINYGTP